MAKFDFRRHFGPYSCNTGVWSGCQDGCEQKIYTGCLGYIGDEILPSYVGIIISPYKDPY